MSVRIPLVAAATLISGGVLLCSSAVQAEDPAAPTIKPDDTWTYKDTYAKRQSWKQVHDQLTVVRAGPNTIELNVKEVGSDRPSVDSLVGADWSRTQNLQGQDTIVSEPLSFPLTKGKTWTVAFKQDHPDRVHDKQTFKTTYRVGDWEDVTVPAGTFHALKIEADGTWSADLAPGTIAANGSRNDAQGNVMVSQNTTIAARTVGGRTYKAYWYVPDVKRWVKAVEDVYDTNGIRSSSYTAELESDKVAR